MKLNPQSWHARWYCLFTNKKEPPDNLCIYVWWLLWQSFLSFFAIGVTAVWIFVIIPNVFRAPLGETAIFAAMTGIASAIFTGAIAVLVWIFKSGAFDFLIAYFKAIKEGYCPRIEWDKE